MCLVIPLRNRHIAQDQKGFADTVMKAELASRLVFLHGYVKAFRDLSKAAQHLTETMLVGALWLFAILPVTWESIYDRHVHTTCGHIHELGDWHWAECRPVLSHTAPRNSLTSVQVTVDAASHITISSKANDSN